MRFLQTQKLQIFQPIGVSKLLLQTSQIPGGFYSKAGRQQAIARLAKKMFHPLDPYTAYLTGEITPNKQDGLAALPSEAALVAAE